MKNRHRDGNHGSGRCKPDQTKKLIYLVIISHRMDR